MTTPFYGALLSKIIQKSLQKPAKTKERSILMENIYNLEIKIYFTKDIGHI